MLIFSKFFKSKDCYFEVNLLEEHAFFYLVDVYIKEKRIPLSYNVFEHVLRTLARIDFNILRNILIEYDLKLDFRLKKIPNRSTDISCMNFKISNDCYDFLNGNFRKLKDYDLSLNDFVHLLLDFMSENMNDENDHSVVNCIKDFFLCCIKN